MKAIISNNKISGSIKAITSKSYAQRAVFASILSKGKSILYIDTFSEDIKSTINVAKDLGCVVEIKKNKLSITPPENFKNNIVINVGESGAVLRFLIPTIAVLGINATIIRNKTLVKRTNKIYFDILPKHGAFIEEDGKNIIQHGKIGSGKYVLEGNVSSQFISGLLIGLSYLKEESEIEISTEIESRPYIDMTIDTLRAFGAQIREEGNSFFVGGGYKASDYVVEKDWSNALYFLIAGVEVKGLNKESKQADRMSTLYLKELGYENISKDNFLLKKVNKEKDVRILDAKNMPDAIVALVIISALNEGLTKVVNIKRLRLKESDRVKSVISMLENLGLNVIEKEDSFEFYGVKKFKKAKIDSFDDHRIVMAATIAATNAMGNIEIERVECVNKSYIGFFEDFKSLGGVVDVK